MTAALKILSGLAKSASVCAVWFAAITIDESALVPIGSVVAVMGGVWYLSARLQRMDDSLKEMNRRLKVLEDR